MACDLLIIMASLSLENICQFLEQLTLWIVETKAECLTSKTFSLSVFLGKCLFYGKISAELNYYVNINPWNKVTCTWTYTE